MSTSNERRDLAASWRTEAATRMRIYMATPGMIHAKVALWEAAVLERCASELDAMNVNADAPTTQGAG